MMQFSDYLAVESGELTLHGIPLSDLAREFGTPLYVYDEQTLSDTAALFTENLRSDAFTTRVVYASKAASFIALIRLYRDLGLCLDVVSEGELYTAQAAGFPMDRVVFHGNNKLDRELSYALELGVGTVVVDNLSEAARLSALCVRNATSCDVLVRINPGIDAHTHAYIQTATSDSKFGIPLHDGAATRALAQISELAGLRLRGVHCHIGSQIFAADSFQKAATVMIEQLAAWKQQGIQLDILDLGGGFGVYYHGTDAPFALAPFLQQLSAHIAAAARAHDVQLSEVWIEPGRSLVNSAGMTLYRIGDIKELPEGVRYAFIDGGMGDNLRPALYQAQYCAAIANRSDEAADQVWRIAGKYCESGDVLLRECELPRPQTGDTLVVFGTGAYTFSMFSDYNRLPRPAVVFVNAQGAREVVKRESLADITRLDIG